MKGSKFLADDAEARLIALRYRLCAFTSNKLSIGGRHALNAVSQLIDCPNQFRKALFALFWRSAI